MTDTDRYDRQERIKGWNQEALSKAHVLVAGAGALGNELTKNLALLGIGHLLVVDSDIIERSNLGRAVLFRDRDIGRPKAQVVAEVLARLNPDINVRYINGDLFYDVGLGFYHHSDLVVGGLDNLAARSRVGCSCSLAGVPFLDGGMWALGGEVRWFLPGEGPCFVCTLSDEDRLRAYERWSCTGFQERERDPDDQPVPTTVSTAAVLGGMLAQETARYLCGWGIPKGEAIVYNGLALTMHRTSLPRDPGCHYHRPYQDIIELEFGVAEVTARDLLEKAEKDLGKPAVLELGRDLLLSFYCPKCKRYENVNELMGRSDESGQICPQCRSVREPKIVSGLEGSEAESGRFLDELGIPLGEVLAVHSEKGVYLYELTGDVNVIWG